MGWSPKVVVFGRITTEERALLAVYVLIALCPSAPSPRFIELYAVSIESIHQASSSFLG